MKTVTKIIAIVLVIVIVGSIGAYAYIQSTKPTPQPSPTPTPTPTTSPTPSPTATPKKTPTPTASPTPSPNPTPSPTPSPTPTPSPVTLIVSTTTSLHDTGLEDVPETLSNGTVVKDDIKDAFQAKYPWITLSFLAQGTGAAIQTAQRGDADMILVHAPSSEIPFLTNGYGVNRKIIAYSFFIIVGPASDPAQINGLTNVSQALTNIYNAAQIPGSNVLWFSRNDASGTNTKEISLWTAAGYNYTQLANTTLNGSWFKSTGAGMGQTLLTANYYGSIGGYTISDMGTYLAYYNRGDIQLKIHVQGLQTLLNVYSAIIDNPQNAALANTHFDASMLFVSWLVSDEGQQIIENYGKAAYHQSLFTSFVPLASGAVSNDTLLGWIKSYAYIDSANHINASGTECPGAYRYNAGTLFSPSYDALANNSLSTSVNFPNYYSASRKEVTLTQKNANLTSNNKISKV